MDNSILVLFASSYNGVRLNKIASFLKKQGFSLSFIGWNRGKNKLRPDDLYDSVTTILRGGGSATKVLPFMYLWYIVKLFFYLLFKPGIKNKTVFAINFESAFVAWSVSKIKKINYIYDIWDEIAISHNFPQWFQNYLRCIDKKVRRDSAFYIHVDENRISDIDSNNYVIIYNSPLDFFDQDPENEYQNSFAVTGWLNKTRGLQSIYDFAKNNPGFRFIVAGEFLQQEYKDKYLSLHNVEYHTFMPQNQLFDIIKDCRGIFSLYDTAIPINRLAASNKLYDAMMLSIPVIVNKDLVAATYVRENNVGFVVDYNYNDSWTRLTDSSIDEVRAIGKSGRKCYLEHFEFSSMMERVFMPAFQSYIKK